MSSRNELPVPAAAKRSADSVEIIRAWIAEEGLHCSLSIGNWPENESIGWGILLSDVVRHVADALRKEQGIEQAETIRQIRITLNKELDHPTAETKEEAV
jgi:hypothetical protein